MRPRLFSCTCISFFWDVSHVHQCIHTYFLQLLLRSSSRSGLRSRSQVSCTRMSFHWSSSVCYEDTRKRSYWGANVFHHSQHKMRFTSAAALQPSGAILKLLSLPVLFIAILRLLFQHVPKLGFLRLFETRLSL